MDRKTISLLICGAAVVVALVLISVCAVTDIFPKNGKYLSLRGISTVQLEGKSRAVMSYVLKKKPAFEPFTLDLCIKRADGAKMVWDKNASLPQMQPLITKEEAETLSQGGEVLKTSSLSMVKDGLYIPLPEGKYKGLVRIYDTDEKTVLDEMDLGEFEVKF